ncbi:exocyst complex component Sec6-domain-containing protein [Scenedesmus sp. NREL 46B-D3]|nr:exocyst complex component Sec6-domain-containing protein [Scenedesmus sp. NREL 46B-D3]
MEEERQEELRSGRACRVPHTGRGGDGLLRAPAVVPGSRLPRAGAAPAAAAGGRGPRGGDAAADGRPPRVHQGRLRAAAPLPGAPAAGDGGSGGPALCPAVGAVRPAWPAQRQGQVRSGWQPRAERGARLPGGADGRRALRRTGRRLPGATDAELAVMQIREEEMFDEVMWLETLLGGCGALEAELAEAYDFVAPCFPPHYNIFDAVFQMYHVQFAQAMDAVGQVSQALSTAGQLRLMQWVCGYQQTLRGLGVQEELVRLPVAPLSCEGAPGFALLIDSYTDRMEATMTAWSRAILAQDIAGQPQQMTDGTLRTPGVVDFFRMLNEQVSVLEEISAGEVLLAAAKRSLKLMQDFVAAQQELLKPSGASLLLASAAAAAGRSGSGGGSGTKLAAATAAAGAAAAAGQKAAGVAVELSFEMVAALLNNSVDCYNQSLEFTEHVQSLLDEGLSAQLDVEDACRAFLDLARAWGQRLVDLMYTDAGLAEQWRHMYSSADWLTGKTCATLLATIGDYFNDITTFVEPGFCRRVCEGVLEEHVRRSSSAAVAALDRGAAAAVAAMGAGAAAAAAAAAAAGGGGAVDAEDVVLGRLVQDERDVQLFFEPYVPRDKLMQRVTQLAGLRELLDSRDTEGILIGYRAVLDLNPAITPAMVEKLLSSRSGLSKAQLSDMSLQCRELYSKALKKQASQASTAAAATPAAAMASGPASGAAGDGSGKGWKFWGR